MSCSADRNSRQHTVHRGRRFEKQAALFFEQQGYEVLERNWQASHLEIDLIVRKDDLIVFVEVKSASGTKFGHPVEKVDRRKTANLTKAARQFVIDRNVSGYDLRFDIVTFVNGQLEHFPGAFEATD
jgi:putative endonuclease